MRLVQVLVPDEQVTDVTDVLDEEDIDYVRQRAWADDEQKWLVSVPVPTDAIRYVLDKLEEGGVDQEEYTTITSLESAMTPSSEALQDRFAGDFDPLTRSEVRAKARDMSRDWGSFLAMIFLSAVIAVAGLLIDSPAVVVGSMVIAPIVGPVLTATVGAATGDRKMLLHSIWLQVGGLAVAVLGATAFSVGLQFLGIFPATLDISSIGLIALRITPSIVTLAIGIAAGAAGAFGLTTKGPTSLIGVMIAAALIPAAATVGIAVAWNEYRIAVGSLLLLMLSIVLINVSAYGVLASMKYRPEREGWLVESWSSDRRVSIFATVLVLVVVVTLVGAASVEQFGFERTVTDVVDETVSEPAYEGTEVVSVRTEYSGVPLGSPETVTVLASKPAEGSGGGELADELDRRITAATGRSVTVRVRYQEYYRSDVATRPQSLGDADTAGPAELATTTPPETRRPRSSVTRSSVTDSPAPTRR